MAPWTIGGLLLALFIGRLWSRRREQSDRVPSHTPPRAEFLLAFVIPLAMTAWGFANYGRYEAQFPDPTPEIILSIAAVPEFFIAVWLTRRHWRARRMLTIGAILAAAHFTAGSWMTAGMALLNAWI